jgi:hypothetical protein
VHAKPPGQFRRGRARVRTTESLYDVYQSRRVATIWGKTASFRSRPPMSCGSLSRRRNFAGASRSGQVRSCLSGRWKESRADGGGEITVRSI